MARHKEFDRDTALLRAIAVFSEHGYEGTSTEALTYAMGISRQSLYDTFGDKRRLYLEALRRYAAESVGDQIRVLNAPASAVAGIGALLDNAVKIATSAPSPTCLGVSSVCEYGRSDPEIAILNDTSGQMLQSALERRIIEARSSGEMDAELATADVASFIQATLVGIKVAARGGASREALRGIARMTRRSLR